MNFLVLDDLKKRRSVLADALQKKRHSAVTCVISQDFINAVDGPLPDKILIEMKTWLQGKSVYNYFNILPKLENIPIVLYNTTDTHASIVGRTPNEKDRILPEGIKLDEIISIAEQDV